MIFQNITNHTMTEEY